MIREGILVAALTDDDVTLGHYLEEVQDRGAQVLTTNRPFELAVLMARRPISAVILRSNLLGETPARLIRSLRELAPRALIVLSAAPEAPLEAVGPLVDAVLVEPFRFSALLEALEFAGAWQVEEAETEGGRDAQEDPEQAPGTEDLPRLVECCRRLTELERDADLLLDCGLEMFLQLADADRGSIMLLNEDGGSLDVVRKIGFPARIETVEPVRLGEALSGQVARSGRPLLGSGEGAGGSRRYRSESFMIVPLVDAGRVLGVVNISEAKGGGPFDQQQLETAQLLARHFAVNLVNARRRAELLELTVLDPLTGLYNRRFFDRQLQVEIERARRTGRQMTLALLDVDKFKLINDFNGYVTGDAVLERVGRLIQKNVREVDVVTRWGGDEFALLLPHTDAEGGTAAARKAVERVRGAIETLDLQREIPGLSTRITLSAGLATHPTHATAAAELFRLADAALKAAKRAGGHTIVVAGEASASTAEAG